MNFGKQPIIENYSFGPFFSKRIAKYLVEKENISRIHRDYCGWGVGYTEKDGFFS